MKRKQLIPAVLAATPADAGPTSAAPIKVPANTAGISCFLFIRLTSFFPLLSLCSLQEQHTGNTGKSLQ